jgi:DNA-binding transcriptional regulator YdaS (Cro superfamily)
MTPVEALTEAINRAGSRYALAKAIGVTTQAVYQWGEQAPVARVLAIEAATGISRHDLRPEIYPREGTAA